MPDVEKCGESPPAAAATLPTPPISYYPFSLVDDDYLVVQKESTNCCPHHSSVANMSFVSASDGEGTAHTCGSSVATAQPLPTAPPPPPPPPPPTSSSSPLSLLTNAKQRATLSVVGAFVALFCTFGQMNSFGTFHAYYSRHQLDHLTPSKISWIGSLQLWIFFFSGGFIGRVFDSYGPTSLMLAGSVCYALSIVATAFSTQYVHYMLSQGLFFGLAVGLLFYPSLASVSTHFSKYRATALGIVAAGSSVGGVVYPIILQRLFESHGFRIGLLICGLSSAIACGFASVTVRTCAPPAPPPCDRKNTTKKSGKNFKFFDLKSISDMRFALLVVGSCFVALGLFTPFFYIVEYAHHLPSPTSQPFNVYYVLAVLNAGGVLGRIAPAYLSDTLGRFNLLFPAALLSGVSCVSLWLCARTIVMLVVFAAVYGFFSGAFVSLIAPCVVQISESGEIGTRIGMLYTIISIPSLIGGPIAGGLFTHDHGSYTGTILFCGTTVMLGSIFILISKLVIDPRVMARV